MAVREPVRWWVIASLVAVFCALLPAPAWMFEEFYSRQLFPWLQGGLTSAANGVPFAMLDALIGLALVLVVWRAVRMVGALRDRGVLSVAGEALRRTVRFTAVVVVLFLVLWGFNYRRMPLEDTVSGLTVVDHDLARLTGAFDDANALATRLRPTVQAMPDLDFAALAQQLVDPMQAALAKLGRPPLAAASLPKASIFVQPFFERAGFDGMINPLALETVVHQGLLPFERPFVLAHEWAHLAGHADEAEASAVGWLACMHGGPAMAYSASLYLLLQAQAAMPADARGRAIARLGGGVRADLTAMAERVRQSEDPRVQQAAERVYDEYLRANRVEDGTASYSRALELILADPFRQTLRNYR